MEQIRRVGIVLARSGSKRLPNKNLLEIRQKSLSQIAVEVGYGAGLEMAISSDSHEILNQEFIGTPLRFMRSAETANDTASSESGVIEVIENLGLRSEDEIVLLPPTSPLRSAHHLIEFLSLWDRMNQNGTFNQAIAVTESRQDLWMVEDDKPIRIREKLSEVPVSRRSQERNPLYFESSAIYLSKVETLQKTGSLIGGKLLLIPLDEITGYDVNTMTDFQISKLLYESRND